jgi:N-dimethylarginine dimethylaminohydrolase
MYAHVKEDGSVDYLGSLPKSWGNVSNLHLSNGDDAYLKTIGWLPLVETNVTPTATQTFDTDLVTVEEDRVILTHRAKDMTAQEIIQRDENYMAYLREHRDQKLVDSDWTQASDHSSPLADAKKAEWSTYRQFLRDLPATVDLTTYPDMWPTEPS